MKRIFSPEKRTRRSKGSSSNIDYRISASSDSENNKLRARDMPAEAGAPNTGAGAGKYVANRAASTLKSIVSTVPS